MNRKILETNLEVDSIITTTNSSVIDLANGSLLAIQAVVDVDTPAAKAFAAGTADKYTLTFEAAADVTDREYFVVYSQDGLGWAIYFDKTGSSAAPTGAIYTAIPDARKAKADISAATDAASVAAIVETAINALTGFSSVITSDDTAADGTMFFLQLSHGTVTAPVSKLQDDSGSGGVGISHTTTGVASDVDVSANTITEATHGFTTGLKGQASSTATLPAGLSAATDYFVIVIDANTYKLATTLNNALAGTAIDITDQGTSAATHTFTPTSIAGATVKLQKSNDYYINGASAHWDDVAAATAISADGDVWFEIANPGYSHARLQYTLTAGRMSTDNYVVLKG